MKRMKVEVLPSPQEIRAIPSQQAEIRRQVQLQVAEIMSERDALVFEPFFRTRQVAYELKRLQSVPEQQKFTIAYEMYGCMSCGTHDTPHAGNNLCHNCRCKWFRRYVQIIGGEIKGERPRSARQTLRMARLLPEHAPQDGVRHTFYERSSELDNLLYSRVAVQLGVTRQHVRSVAIGSRRSEPISSALKSEREKMLKEGEE